MKERDGKMPIIHTMQTQPQFLTLFTHFLCSTLTSSLWYITENTLLNPYVVSLETPVMLISGGLQDALDLKGDMGEM